MNLKNQYKNYYLICYDISDQKIRNRVVKILLKYSFRVQYSVFEAYLPSVKIDKMKNEIESLIKSTDSFRIYKLTDSNYNDKIVLGKQFDHRPYEDEIL